MAVTAFTSYQGFDETVAIKLQTVYGTGVTPNEYFVARNFRIDTVNAEVTSIGTSNYRGILTSQRTKAGRFATLDFTIDLVNNTPTKTVLEWGMGAATTLANAIKFASIGVRHSDGDGFTLDDCAVTRLAVIFTQGDVATVEVSAVCLTDWTASTAPAAGTPASGTPIIIDDLSVNWNSVAYPVNGVGIELEGTVIPIFANEAFPVSFQSPNGRQATSTIEFPATSTTFDLIGSLKADTSSDLAFTTALGGFSSTLKNARLIDAGGAEFLEGNVAPVISTFRGSATDTDTPELTMAFA